MSDFKDNEYDKQKTIISQIYKKLKNTKWSKSKGSTEIQNENDDSFDSNFKEAYVQEILHSVIFGTVDPISNMLESHTLIEKYFHKSILIYCDVCDLILNGSKGYKCSKCDLTIHDKCEKNIKENCLLRRLYNCDSNSSKLNDSLQHCKIALDSRIKLITRVYPSFFKTLALTFNLNSEEFQKYLDKIKEEYLTKGINSKHFKKRLKVCVRYGTNIYLDDWQSLASTYVTVRLSNSVIKRTKTQLNKENPVWNEVLEFDYFNSYEIKADDSTNYQHLNEKLLVALWQEKTDNNKKQKSNALPDDNSKCLGTLVININQTLLDKDEIYKLNSESENNNFVRNIVLCLSFESNLKLTKSNSDFGHVSLTSMSSLMYVSTSVFSYMEQYEYLCRHIFDYLYKTRECNSLKLLREKDEWILECIPKDAFPKYYGNSKKILEFFSVPEYNFILQTFADKYCIKEIYRLIYHFSCIFEYLFNRKLLKELENKNHKNCIEVNQQAIHFMNELLSHIIEFYNVNPEYSHIGSIVTVGAIFAPVEFNKFIEFKPPIEFLQQVYTFPDKIIHFLSDYRSLYQFEYEIKTKAQLIDKDTKINELKELIYLFKNCSTFTDNHLCTYLYQIGTSEKELNNLIQISNENSRFHGNDIPIGGYAYPKQIEIIEKCVEKSIFQYYDSKLSNSKNKFKFGNISTFNESSSSNIFLNNEKNDSISKDLILSRPNNYLGVAHSLMRRKSWNDLSVAESMSEIFELKEIITNFMQHELKLQIECFKKAFTMPYPTLQFEKICKNSLFQKYYEHLNNVLRKNARLIPKFRSEHISQHLALYLSIKIFYNNHMLPKYNNSSQEIYDSEQNENETIIPFFKIIQLFQPFLKEYINQQEDQFLKYLAKIYEMENIEMLARKINDESSNDIFTRIKKVILPTNENDTSTDNVINEENNTIMYNNNNYLSSITDLFTILHEIASIIIQYDSSDAQLNSVHHSVFIKLIKGNILKYLTDHIRKMDDLESLIKIKKIRITIECIIMNNFYKICDNIAILEKTLETVQSLHKSMSDQFLSIKSIINETLNELIDTFIRHYFDSPIKALLRQIHYDFEIDNKTDFNDFFETTNCILEICYQVLFNPIFDDLIECLFRRFVKEFDISIVANYTICSSDSNHLNIINNEQSLNTYAKYLVNRIIKVSTNIFSNSSYSKNLNRKSKNEFLLNDKLIYLKQCFNEVLDFLDHDKSLRNKLAESVEYKSLLSTFDLCSNSSDMLINLFIKNQKKQSPLNDFYNATGKLQLLVQIKKKIVNKLDSYSIRINFVKAIELFDFKANRIDSTSFFLPNIDIYLIEPNIKNKWKFKTKTIKCNNYDNSTYFFNDYFDFDVDKESNLNYSPNKQFNNFDIQIVVLKSKIQDINYNTTTTNNNNTNSSEVIGLIDLNINDLLVKDGLNKANDESKFCTFNLLVSIRPKLKIDQYGYKILSILKKYSNDQFARQFVNLKLTKKSKQNSNSTNEKELFIKKENPDLFDNSLNDILNIKRFASSIYEFIDSNSVIESNIVLDKALNSIKYFDSTTTTLIRNSLYYVIDKCISYHFLKFYSRNILIAIRYNIIRYLLYLRKEYDKLYDQRSDNNNDNNSKNKRNIIYSDLNESTKMYEQIFDYTKISINDIIGAIIINNLFTLLNLIKYTKRSSINAIYSLLEPAKDIIYKSLSFIIKRYSGSYNKNLYELCNRLDFQKISENDLINTNSNLKHKIADNAMNYCLNNSLIISKSILCDASFKLMIDIIIKNFIEKIRYTLEGSLLFENISFTSEKSNYLVDGIIKTTVINVPETSNNGPLLKFEHYEFIKNTIFHVIETINSFDNEDTSVLNTNYIIATDKNLKHLFKILDLYRKTPNELIDSFIKSQSNHINYKLNPDLIDFNDKNIIHLNVFITINNHDKMILVNLEILNIYFKKENVNYIDFFLLYANHINDDNSENCNDMSKPFTTVKLLLEKNELKDCKNLSLKIKLNNNNTNLMFNDSMFSYLKSYEIQINIRNNKLKLIGTSVLNLGQLLMKNYNDIYINKLQENTHANVSLYVVLKSKLHINKQEYRILSVLNKFKSKNIIRFVKLKKATAFRKIEKLEFY